MLAESRGVLQLFCARAPQPILLIDHQRVHQTRDFLEPIFKQKVSAAPKLIKQVHLKRLPRPFLREISRLEGGGRVGGPRGPSGSRFSNLFHINLC